jgi:hypothetical protein
MAPALVTTDTAVDAAELLPSAGVHCVNTAKGSTPRALDMTTPDGALCDMTPPLDTRFTSKVYCRRLSNESPTMRAVISASE